MNNNTAENDISGRTYIKRLMNEAGLTVTEDSMGSIFGTWPSDIEGPFIATGSHCDAIPLAGAYDGTTGVIGGIAAIKAIKDSGFRPTNPLRVIMFTSEEPTRFGLGCIGSRAMAGALSIQEFSALKDNNGSSFLEAAHDAGSALDHKTLADLLQAANAKQKGGDSGMNKGGTGSTTSIYKAFVELHIEQGPELEAEKLDIGIVTSIAAPATLRIAFRGGGGHAGALLMPRRNDAALAAAELALGVEAAALDTGAIDTVATTGRWVISPNAVNSVPREALVEIDVRDVDAHRRDGVVAKIQKSATAIALHRKVALDVSLLNSDPPAASDDGVMRAVEESVEELRLTSKKMVSRAYHDSLFMAQIAPTGMIFIPCEGGKSHRPDEFASARDIENGVRVLAGTLMKLAGGSGGDGGRDGEL